MVHEERRIRNALQTQHEMNAFSFETEEYATITFTRILSGNSSITLIALCFTTTPRSTHLTPKPLGKFRPLL